MAKKADESKADASQSELVVTPDDRRFRDVFGHFVTGVTIVTAMDGDAPVGMAANSFTSLSLAPPLVLFCVADSSSTWPRIESAGRFAINILGEEHESLSQLFALKGADRFSKVQWRRGISGAPVLDDAIAYIDCEFEAKHPGGDHQIVVGRVVDVDMRQDARPLVFFKGAYRKIRDGE
jgi:3-hydroxy-9,10-secoandrosta-1,3,5(10)-triene-9,17-dione monooxygenase reductase component